MRRWAFVLLFLVAGLFASCKDATQVTVVLRTNVAYAEGTGVALWSSRSGAVGAPVVESSSPWLADGELGDVVVIPGDASKDSQLTLRVAMGLRGRRPDTCADDGDLTGCIIARRKLSFVPSTPLKVPIVMYLACEGVKCSEDTTCSYLGQCVPARVDPTTCTGPEGCTLPGEPPFVPGVVGDAGRDINGDSPPDTSVPVDAPGDVTAETDAPADVGAVPSAPEVSAGLSHTCARLAPGTVKCWGKNNLGQLGLGDTQDRGDGPAEMGANLPAVDLGPGRTALQVATGFFHTCARLDNGTVKCWGRNDLGQLGLGDTQDRGDGPAEMGANLPAVNLGPGRTALELAVGDSHTCARLDDSTVKCWGRNNFGQLGLGDTQDRGDAPAEMGANLPALDLGPGRTALQLASTGLHTCARLDNGTVKCWGFNNFGELGLGDTLPRGDGPGEMGTNLPVVDLGAGRTALQLAVSSNHACARLDDGSVKCWGLGVDGQLGLGDTLTRGDGPGEMGGNLPTVDLGPGRTALAIFAGGQQTCARLDDTSVKCWGRNDVGQLGLGDTLVRGDAPAEMGANLPSVDLGPGRTALHLAARGTHACAGLDDGTVKCWGFNFFGELGLGDTQTRGGAPGQMGANLPAVQLQ